MSGIKIIKFDLPINGIKVKTLDELRDNLTDELVTLARSGQLERWLASRKHEEIAQAVAAAVVAESDDKALFLALCRALGVEVHPDDVAALFDESPQAGRCLGSCGEEPEPKISLVAIREVVDNFLLPYMKLYNQVYSSRNSEYRARDQLAQLMLMLDSFSELEFRLHGEKREYFSDGEYFSMFAKPEAVVKVGDVVKKGAPIAFSKDRIFLSRASGRVKLILCDDSRVDILIDCDSIKV